MAIDWIKGFLIPIIEIVIIGGVGLVFIFYIYKAGSNVWKKQMKFIIKYQIMRKKASESTVIWCVECIDKGIGWYDAKKLLLIGMIPENQINETMYVYDQILNQLNKDKGGILKDGRKLKRSYSKIEGTTKLPSF